MGICGKTFRNRRMLPIVLGVWFSMTMFLTVVVRQVNAGVLFEDGFESGDTRAWSEDDGWTDSGGFHGVDCNFAHTGSCSYRVTYTRNEHYGSPTKNLPGYEHLFHRWYEYFGAGFDFPEDLKMSRMLKSGVFTVGTHLFWGGGHAGIQSNHAGVEKSDIQPYGWKRETWICMEQEAKLNTPGQKDGIIRLWMDGALVAKRSDAFMRGDSGVKIQRFWNGGNYSNLGKNPSRPSHRYVDDVVLGTTRIGCLPDVADKNPPKAPTGLRINSQ